MLVLGFSPSCFLENEGIFSNRSSVGTWVFSIVFSGKRGHFFWCVAVLVLGFSPSCFLDNEGVFSPFSGRGFVVGFSGA